MVNIETIRGGTNDGANEGDLARTIPMFSVKYKDVFHLRNLYVMMHELLLEEGWYGFDNEQYDLTAHSDIETLYSENVLFGSLKLTIATFAGSIAVIESP